MWNNIIYRIWPSHSGDYEEYSLVGLTPWNTKKAWCFRGTYCLHLQSYRVSQARNQNKQALSSGTISFAPVSYLWFPLSLALPQFNSGLDWPIQGLIFHALFILLATWFYWFLAWLSLQPWRWRWYIPPKSHAFSELHSATTKKRVLSMPY
jgi:hypothetical protein